MQGPVSILHHEEPLADFEVLPGLFFSPNDRISRILVADRDGEPGNVKIFIGYSGWGPNQLESEIEQGAWKTIGATNEQIFAEVTEQWERLFKQIAGVNLVETLHIKHIPPDLRMN